MKRVDRLPDRRFADWMEALERRHLARLTVSEVRRGVQALSGRYVEHRSRCLPGSVLDGAGKRAAFALFYAPLHFLVVRHVVEALRQDTRRPLTRILDLGCGSGAAGAAWAVATEGRPAVLTGIDRHPWALEECRWTWKVMGLRGRVRRGDLARARLPGERAGVLLAYALNELQQEHRTSMLQRLIAAAGGGARVIVVEPIARRVSPWWDEWEEAFISAGGRSDEWRFAAVLPDLVRLLDKAAGLDHRELTARTLWL